MQKEHAVAEKALAFRRGDRAAECTGLENRRVFTGTVGSNPTLSASFLESMMPIYNYRCENCSAEFEKILPFSERDQNCLFCPECGSDEVTKIMSRSTFSLKGKGWYKDGYSNDKSKK